MTGYGEAAATVDGVNYFVQLRSLNNKYFKATIRLPEEFQSLEAQIESVLREKISRGSVVFSASCGSEASSAAYDINTAALERYLQQLQALPQIASGQLRLEIGPLLHLPGVLQQPEQAQERLHRAREVFTDLLGRALEGLLAMRKREGQTLVADLRLQQEVIRENLATITAQAQHTAGQYEQRLRTRIEQSLRQAGVQAEPGDLIREVAIYAERCDIAEEINRLGGHLTQFSDLLTNASEKPLGRTLDFLAQEMLREANTIASKSLDAGIARCSVQVKSAIDRIKEQAQNME